MTLASPRRPLARPLRAALLALAGLAAPPASAAPPRDNRVPVTLNIGLGPAIGTVVLPGLGGPPPISLGFGLRVEGYLDARTLHSKKVMRQVPRQYRGMVRSSKDMHILPFPTPFIPDIALISPLTGREQGPQVRAVGWEPISLYLLHKVKPAHKLVSIGPRLGWVGLDGDAAASPEASSHGYLGLNLKAEHQTDMQEPIGGAFGADVAPGFVLPRTVAGQAGAGGFGLWVDGYARLQLRMTVRVKP